MKEAKLKRTWVKFNDLDPKIQKIRVGILTYEIALAITGFGLMLACLIIGDPYNRLASTLGVICVGLAPMILERLLKHRFTLIQHILYDVYLTMSTLIGSALFMFDVYGPMDEIMHFIFGYFGSIVAFYFILHFIKCNGTSLGMITLVTFMLSMGTAAVWEVMEFCVDVLIGQNSLGYLSEDIIEIVNQKIAELNLSGIGAAFYKLEYVGVLDTVSDLTLHVLGSTLFAIHFYIHKKTGKNLLIGYLTEESINNKFNMTAKQVAQMSVQTKA